MASSDYPLVLNISNPPYLSLSMWDQRGNLRLKLPKGVISEILNRSTLIEPEISLATNSPSNAWTSNYFKWNSCPQMKTACMTNLLILSSPSIFYFEHLFFNWNSQRPMMHDKRFNEQIVKKTKTMHQSIWTPMKNIDLSIISRIQYEILVWMWFGCLPSLVLQIPTDSIVHTYIIAMPQPVALWTECVDYLPHIISYIYSQLDEF